MPDVALGVPLVRFDAEPRDPPDRALDAPELLELRDRVVDRAEVDARLDPPRAPVVAFEAMRTD